MLALDILNYFPQNFKLKNNLTCECSCLSLSWSNQILFFGGFFKILKILFSLRYTSMQTFKSNLPCSIHAHVQWSILTKWKTTFWYIKLHWWCSKIKQNVIHWTFFNAIFSKMVSQFRKSCKDWDYGWLPKEETCVNSNIRNPASWITVNST